MTRLYKAGAVSLAVTDGTISTATPLALTVAMGPATRLRPDRGRSERRPRRSDLPLRLSGHGLGNSGTISANVSVTDSAGNIVSDVGSGHTRK